MPIRRFITHRRTILLVMILVLGIASWLWYFHDRPSRSLVLGQSFAFSADGHTFVSTTNEGIVVLSYPELQRIHVWPMPDETIDTAFSTDGAWLARQTVATIEIWRVADGTRTASIPNVPARTLYKLYFNQQGTALIRVATDRPKTQFWRLMNGNVVQAVPALSTAVALALSADGQLLAEQDGDQGIRIVRLSDQQIIRTFPFPISQSTPMNALTFSADGTLLAVAPGMSRQPIWVWRISNGALIAKLPGVPTPINQLMFNADHTLLGAAVGDSEYSTGASVWIWQVPEQTILHTFPAPKRILKVAFSRDSLMMAATGGDHTIRFWRVPQP